jgi:putative endonuclease
MFLSRTKLLTDRKRLGRWSEKRCERFLRRKGFKTLARNFSCKTGEIDLVMVDTDGSVVFVEVRSKADTAFAPPEDSVTPRKKARLVRTARYFLAAHNIENRPCRFDVVAIVLPQAGPPQITHYPNAFVP